MAAGSRTPSRPRLGLALACGAPEGAIYEVGALRALDEALGEGVLTEAGVYVGVSAGGLLAACLANGLDSRRLVRAIVSQEPGDHPVSPEKFLTPAVRHWWGGGRRLPALVAAALGEYLRAPRTTSLSASLTRLARALPVGLFDSEPIRAYVASILDRPGRTDDFRELAAKLVVVAADLDSGLAVRFGEPPFDDVPISRAVQASSALPGLYPPVEIDGRSYVDGVLLKTLHASVALDAGAELVLCVNPIVPVDTARAVEAGVMRRGRLIDRGLPGVLSQTFRTLIHSRLEVGMAAYQGRYQGRDLVLVEPRRDDYRMFFTNIFGFADRVAVCEHAYQETRRHLLARHDELAPIFERHGLHLDRAVLEAERDLWRGVGFASRPTAGRGGLRGGRGRRASDEPRAAAANGDAFVTHRLSDALDRLDRLVAPPAAAAEPPAAAAPAVADG